MIIPVYNVVASNIAIAASTEIEAGMAVMITAGYAAVTSAQTDAVIGLAGDRNRSLGSGDYSNRVSDFGYETGASGMLTVYHSGGEFYVDVDDSAITTQDGTSITGVVTNGSTKTAGTLLYPAASGQLSSTGTFGTDIPVAMILENTGALDSGIPGEYEPGSSVQYVTDGTSRTWVKIKLMI